MLPPYIVLYDGQCCYCHSVVQFTQRIDIGGVLHYAWLQGETGRNILQQHGLPHDYNESYLFLNRGKLYANTTATCHLLWQLQWPWKIAGVLLWMIPWFLRDAVYNIIATNRYRWFGKADKCQLPPPEMRSRFLP